MGDSVLQEAMSATSPDPFPVFICFYYFNDWICTKSLTLVSTAFIGSQETGNELNVLCLPPPIERFHCYSWITFNDVYHQIMYAPIARCACFVLITVSSINLCLVLWCHIMHNIYIVYFATGAAKQNKEILHIYKKKTYMHTQNTHTDTHTHANIKLRSTIKAVCRYQGTTGSAQQTILPLINQTPNIVQSQKFPHISYAVTRAYTKSSIYSSI